MDVEKHGGGRQVVDLVAVGNNVRVESDTIPNFLGKSGKLVEALVNGDSDTWKDPRGIESAKETEGVLENGIIRSTSALHVSHEGVVGPVVSDMEEEELGGPVLSGPAQLGEKKCEIEVRGVWRKTLMVGLKSFELEIGICLLLGIWCLVHLILLCWETALQKGRNNLRILLNLLKTVFCLEGVWRVKVYVLMVLNGFNFVRTKKLQSGTISIIFLSAC
jgi:hypothetical protein